MVQRFNLQLPAILAALLDERLKKTAQAKTVQKMSDDQANTEAFVCLMEKVYTSTLALSTDSKPTAGLVLPIMAKLLKHCEPKDDDSNFVQHLKKEFGKNLKTRYQHQEIRELLEECTCMDPRFKSFIQADCVWQRLEAKACE